MLSFVQVTFHVSSRLVSEQGHVVEYNAMMNPRVLHKSTWPPQKNVAKVTVILHSSLSPLGPDQRRRSAETPAHFWTGELLPSSTANSVIPPTEK